jgi:peptidyl-prolyl cis-trans isomerase D
MITFFRRWLTSWPALILLGLVLVAFAITGIGDPFGAGGNVPAGAVARVGERNISENEVSRAFDRLVRTIREQDPQAAATEIAKEGGVAVAINQLIGQAAMVELGEQMGLSASDRAIGAVIAGVQAFQLGGKFDEATFRAVLAQQRLSDKELREGIHDDLVRRQLLTPVTASLGVPVGMATPYAQLLVDIHRGAVALVPLMPGDAPTAAEVEKFYKANAAAFTLPERRAFRFAVLDTARIAAGVQVGDAQVAAAFAKDPAKYGAAATRRLSQVVVADEATAKAIVAAAAKEGFAGAAQRLGGFGAADIALGEQTQADFAKATSAAVAAAAFSAPVGGITPPIKTDFGWHVVKVEATGAGKTLAEVKGRIEADLRAAAARTAVADLVARIEDGVEGGKSFADIARDNGLTIVTQGAVTADGGGDPELAKFAAKAFRHEPGDGAAVEDLAEPGSEAELIVIETMQVLPPTLQPLDAVRAVATEGAARDKALATARKKADAVIAAVKKGGNFIEAVAAQGLPPAQPLAGRRADVLRQPNVPPIIRAFLDTPAGTVQVVPSPQGWVLIHTSDIEKGNLDSVPGLVEASRNEIAGQLPEEFAAAFAGAAERAMGTTRNQGTIDALTRRLSGLETEK